MKTVKKIAEKSTELVSGLKKAVKDSLSSRFKPGTSKKEARDEYNARVREEARAKGATEEEIRKMPFLPSPYIHSYNTYHQYLYICEKFAEWVEVTHTDCRKLSYIHRMGYDREYIQLMIDAGYAPSTVARTTSAIAKLLHSHAPEIHDKRPQRRYRDNTRSRNYNNEKYAEDVAKRGMIAEVCRMTGVRRCELRHLRKHCFCEGEDGRIYVHLDGKEQHTKGGLTRDVVVLEGNQQRLREILDTFKDDNALMFPEVPTHMDVHGIRALYAMDYYGAIARNIKDISKDERIPLKRAKKDSRRPNQVRTTAPGVYTRRSDGRSFDRRALLTVSRSLGHSREDVVVQNYLR